MKSRPYTSKDIKLAFGISNQEQLYFLDQNFIFADVKVIRPRLYSLPMAMLCGAIRYFENHGYKIVTASRIAKFCIAPVVFVNSRIKPEINILLSVTSSFQCDIFPVVDDAKEKVSLFSYLAEDAGDAPYNVGRRWNEGKNLGVCTYYLRSLWSIWASALKADYRQIQKSPDFGIRWSGASTMFMENDEIFLDNKDKTSPAVQL